MADPEGEVRTAAAGRITGKSFDHVLKGLSLTIKIGYSQLIEKQVVIDRLLPCVRDLVGDENQYARAALAKEVSGLAIIVGQDP